MPERMSFPSRKRQRPRIFRRVMSMWPSIVAQTTGRFKMTLISAVPKYNAAGEDNRLFVVFSDFMGERYANDPEAKKQLENDHFQQTRQRGGGQDGASG